MDFREDQDSMGIVKVPTQAYYGAQTQRSLENFPIGNELMPSCFIAAMAMIKEAAAITNCDLGLLSRAKADLIVAACQEISAGQLADQFPLKIWQTGSGTQ